VCDPEDGTNPEEEAVSTTDIGGEASSPSPNPRAGEWNGTYGSYVSFKDPDGNPWLVQEISTRLPGR